MKLHKDKNLLLVDIDGFSKMKYICTDNTWLEILHNFKEEILNCFLDKEILFFKSLGDGLLIINETLSSDEWFHLSNIINNKLINWQKKYSIFVSALSYSIVISKGNYYSVSYNDIVGKDIDELFLIEHNAPVGKVLITQKMYNTLSQKANLKKDSTTSIFYLDNLKIIFYCLIDYEVR